MYGLEVLVLTGAVAVATGLGLGLLIGRKFSADRQKQRELERHLDRLGQEQKNYQHEVAEHFSDTAKLLRNLAESYRDVHNHLASGAENLCSESHNVPVLNRLPESVLGVSEVDTAEVDPATVSAPLDYAPKSSPYETGMLNEEFGLEKPANDDDAELAEPQRH